MFVATSPVIDDFLTKSIIISIDSSVSSGEIFKKIGFLKLSLAILFSTEVIRFCRFSFKCKSLKSGVLGEDIFIVM